jgi:uncharacterized membrane protein
MASSHILKVSRLEGLTDGIFAIAMTILILDLRLPTGITPHTLANVFVNVVFAKLFIYVFSFTILGTLWIAMHFQMGMLDRVNRPYLWANIFYLMVVCVVPFSASLVSAYPDESASIWFYAMNLIFAYLGQILICETANYYKLNNDSYTPAIRRAVLRRIYIAPIFYICSLIIANWDTSLAFVILIVPTLIYLIPGRVDSFDR